MVCVYSLSYAPALLLLPLPHYYTNNGPLLLFFLLVVQSSDVFQYVCGKLWGKHKLSPRVSPSKTVEGLRGGGARAIALGTVLYGLTPFKVWQAALMAAVTVTGGFVGGLVLSSDAVLLQDRFMMLLAQHRLKCRAAMGEGGRGNGVLPVSRMRFRRTTKGSQLPERKLESTLPTRSLKNPSAGYLPPACLNGAVQG